MIVPTDVLYSDVENFEGGKLKYYYEHWKKYTSDTFILEIIKNGLKLDLNEILFQHCCNNFPLSKEEMSIINSEIQKLKSKKVIVNTDRRTGDYIFDVFTRSKKDESPRKSVLKPTQNLICLGFIINSKDMTLTLTEEKKQKIYDLCTNHFEKSKLTI